MAKDKTWFGKRWTKGGVNWLDAAIFGKGRDVENFSMASSFCNNFTIGLIGGFVFAVLTLFYEAKTLNLTVTPIIFGLSLIVSITLLWGTLHYFESSKDKALRSIYVIILNFIGCGIGVFLGVWMAIIVLTLLALWLVLQIWASSSSDSSSSKSESYVSDQRREFRLEDGTTIKQESPNSNTYSDGVGGRYRETCGGQFEKL